MCVSECVSVWEGGESRKNTAGRSEVRAYHTRREGVKCFLGGVETHTHQEWTSVPA